MNSQKAEILSHLSRHGWRMQRVAHYESRMVGRRNVDSCVILVSHIGEPDHAREIHAGGGRSVE